MNLAQSILEQELHKQLNSISLIASENITSLRVRNALSSVLTNKYAEGYPHRRYYSGCENADSIEQLAIDLIKKIFKAQWANVQPHSGSQANQAVFSGLLNIGDSILSLSLKSGGHLTHGAEVSFTNKLYKIFHYELDESGLVNMDQVEDLAKLYAPKLIIAGGSAYSRLWDWKRFREIADLNNSYLLADVAHIAGIIAANLDTNPINYADVITSTTHKTLRGPRGGLILSNDIELGKKIDKALFPGLQGGPLMNNIGAKALAFEEILDPNFGFEAYMKNVLKNSQILSQKLIQAGAHIVSGGTDNHLMILDCLSLGLNAKEIERKLSEIGVYVSLSALKEDSWLNANGIRIGTPYISNILDDISDFSELFVDAIKYSKYDSLKQYIKSLNIAACFY